MLDLIFSAAFPGVPGAERPNFSFIPQPEPIPETEEEAAARRQSLAAALGSAMETLVEVGKTMFPRPPETLPD